MFRIAFVLGAALAVSACNNAASLSCEQIADQAKQITQTQGTAVTAITDIREVSATPTERRCTGTAATALGSTEVHMRGFQAENGDQRVEIRETPFE